LHGVKLAAVGRATAARLAERGVLADVVGDGGGAELAATLVAEGAEGPAIVFGAAGGRAELGDALAAAGWTVETVAAYDTVPDDGAIARAWKLHHARPFDAIAFTSPKGARAFLDGGAPVDRAASGPLAGVRIGAIGATTREALVAAGLAVTAVPPSPDVAHLIDALAKLE
jgi:uroporphyrinogen-III synthase